MTERTLREKIEALRNEIANLSVWSQKAHPDQQLVDLAHVLAILDAHTAQPSPIPGETPPMGYETAWQPVANDAVPCRKCGEAGGIEYREWESSCGGYEDYHYRCTKCGNDWWIEGADA